MKNDKDSRYHRMKNKILNNNKISKMKYLKSVTTRAIICYLLLSTVISCTEGNHMKSTSPERFKSKYKVVTVDKCEYIQYASSFGFVEVTHKGDCKNPIHDCR